MHIAISYDIGFVEENNLPLAKIPRVPCQLRGNSGVMIDDSGANTTDAIAAPAVSDQSFAAWGGSVGMSSILPNMPNTIDLGEYQCFENQWERWHINFREKLIKTAFEQTGTVCQIGMCTRRGGRNDT